MVTNSLQSEEEKQQEATEEQKKSQDTQTWEGQNTPKKETKLKPKQVQRLLDRLFRKKTAFDDNDAVEELEKAKRQEVKSRRKQNRKLRIRKFPILLRIVVVLILLCISLALGLMVGFGVLGDGNPTDALNKDTWQHIIDIVKKKK